jgi:hypothetical protein
MEFLVDSRSQETPGNFPATKFTLEEDREIERSFPNEALPGFGSGRQAGIQTLATANLKLLR